LRVIQGTGENHVKALWNRALNSIFPSNFSICPEYRLSDGNRPDFVVTENSLVLVDDNHQRGSDYNRFIGSSTQLSRYMEECNCE